MRTGLALRRFLLVVRILGAAAISNLQGFPDSKPQPLPVSNSQPSTVSNAQPLTVSQPAVTTLMVTLSSDNDPGGFGEVGDLRYALNTMNQGLNTTPDDYEIVFAAPMTIQLNGILPVINNSANAVNITIGNPGSSPTVTIDGNSGAYPGFFIAMGNVTIQNMTFQNLTAKGGNGGNGISGGGGGLGAGGAIYAPQTFLNGSNPSITLINVSINNCSAAGGNGGSYLSLSTTGNEGGGGGGGFSGNGGSITTTGSTGGGGGGGFGGNGGDVTLSTDDLLGGGGGGGGGLGSRATIGSLTNLGNGGSDQDFGQDGNGIGLTITAGSGGGGNSGGNNAGGGGGGGPVGIHTFWRRRRWKRRVEWIAGSRPNTTET